MAERQAELKRYLDDAFQAFEAGQDERARRLCRQALEIDPESSTAHSLMGLLYEREGLSGQAATEFERVITHNPMSQAERVTLERMRAEGISPVPTVAPPLDFGAELAEERRSPLPALIAGVVALALFLVVVTVGVQHVGHARVARVATSDTDPDLRAAREAFAGGRYDEALGAAQRVLARDPANRVAQEIRDRCEAFLTGGTPPPAQERAATSSVAPPPPTVQTQPAPSNTVPAPAAPGVMGPPQPVQMAQASAAPAPPAVLPPPALPAAGSAVAPALVLPPIADLHRRPDYRVPGTPFSGAKTVTVRGPRIRMPGVNYGRMALPHNQETGDVGGRRPPAAPDIQPDNGDRGTGSGHAKPEGQADSSGYIHIEVYPRRRTGTGNTPAPEVTPDLTKPPATRAPAPRPAPPAANDEEEN